MIEAVADQVFIPLTVGGGVNSVDDVRALLNAGADKVSINTAGVERPELFDEAAAHFGAQCIVAAIDAKQYAVDALGGVHPRRPHAHRHRCRRMGAGGRGARRGRDPAHQHGPRRRAQRLRPRAHARGGRRGRRAGDRIGRRGHAAASGRRHRAWAAPTRCWPRRSSTTASSRSAQAKAAMRNAGIEMREVAMRSRMSAHDDAGSTTCAGTRRAWCRRSRRTPARAAC